MDATTVAIMEDTTPYEAGRTDALMGLPCDPSIYGYSSVADCFDFRTGWYSVTELPISPEYPMFDFDAELDDLIEGRLDEEYHSRGAW